MRISYQKRFSGSDNVIISINKILLLLMIFFQSINAALEKTLGNIDQGKVFGTLPTDLSKPFEWNPHDLFLGKFQGYGFDNKSPGLVEDNFSNRKCKTNTKVGQELITWQEILSGVRQGSITSSPLFFFNIHHWISQMIILYMTAKNTKRLVKSIESIVYRTFR